MLIIPAIDIIDGEVVRLSKGEFDSVIKYGKSPVEQACIYDDLGFEWLHIVDLTGSKEGRINTLKIIEGIKKVTKLKIEFGGGIRDKNIVSELIDMGVDKIVIGSLSITNKNEFQSIFSIIDPDRIMIAADILDYHIRIKGWTEETNVHLFDHIKFCNQCGIENFLCTDISVDGMLTGPNINLYNMILKKFPKIKLTASGGVGCIDDIYKLQKLPLRGVVVGKAIYEDKINLKELSKIAV